MKIKADIVTHLVDGAIEQTIKLDHYDLNLDRLSVEEAQDLAEELLFAVRVAKRISEHALPPPVDMNEIPF